jgi:hypothetical protein
VHIEILVEEPSMEEVLQNILPLLLSDNTDFRIITFQGKSDMLQKLPYRMRGYKWIPEDFRIVTLVDKDKQNCLEIKTKLEQAAILAGFSTKTSVRDSRFQVLNRIVIEELESWFLGDLEAVRQAYPRLPAHLINSKRFADPDSIKGGTWETIEKLLKKYGYFKEGYRKLEAAREISAHMDPDRNRSKSFQVFRAGLLALE